MSFGSAGENKLFYPVLGALLLHLALILLAMFIVLPAMVEMPPEAIRTFNVKTISMKPLGRGSERPIKLVHDVKLGPILEKESSGAPPVEAELRRTMEFEESSLGTVQDMDRILSRTEERQLRDVVPQRQKSAGQSRAEATLKKATEGMKTGMAHLLAAFQKPAAIDPEEGMPGFTPSAQGTPRVLFSSVTEEGIGESKAEVVKYEALDDFMDIATYTYKDPQTTQKYFMIKIFAKKGNTLFKPIPKEILFTIDASLSISKDRLEEVKRGISYCLTHLNAEDMFNIIAFKDSTLFFSPRSVAATPETVKAAEKFVSGLEASQQTDVYLAFKKIVELPLGRIPSNVILISDGRPTHGLVNSREVISSVSRLNGKTRPVFAFSGGAKVNRYLLDFIAYQNRAWSQFMKKTPDIHKGLAEFYDKIRNPLFLNLRYRLNGLNEEEVFPKSLPDFYENAEFTLYGTYKDEDAFSMQLLGDLDGQTKELIFSRSLTQANKGSEDIMRGYAFNKIYHLISQITTNGPNPKLLKEIEDLSRRYGITTPYSPELEKAGCK